MPKHRLPTKSSKPTRYLEQIDESSDESDSDTSHTHESDTSSISDPPKRVTKRRPCLQTRPTIFVVQCKQQAKDKAVITYRLSGGAGYDAHVSQYPDGELHDLACLVCKTRKARRTTLGYINAALLAAGSQPTAFTEKETVCTRHIDGITNVYLFLSLIP
jgi:hypothetical protein